MLKRFMLNCYPTPYCASLYFSGEKIFSNTQFFQFFQLSNFYKYIFFWSIKFYPTPNFVYYFNNLELMFFHIIMHAFFLTENFDTILLTQFFLYKIFLTPHILYCFSIWCRITISELLYLIVQEIRC